MAGAGGVSQLLQARDPRVVFRDHEAELDRIAGVQAAQFRRVLHREGHGHGFHVARDFFVLDVNRRAVGVEAADAAPDLEGLFARGACGLGGLMRLTGQHYGAGDHAERGEAEKGDGNLHFHKSIR